MLDGKLPGGSVAMAANSSPSGAMNRPKAGPLVTVWLPVQSAFTVYVKGVTKFSSTIVVPIRTVTVAVPVPSPLKIFDPASAAGVGTVTPSHAGSFIDKPGMDTRLRYFDFATSQSTTVAANLGMIVGAMNGPGGLTASRDGRTVFFAR